MRPIPFPSIALPALLSLTACATIQKARDPAYPIRAAMPAPGQVPDQALLELIEDADLIVLATPVDVESEHGVMTATFQFGAKETWYDAKLEVAAVAKGKLKSAKWVDYGAMPAAWQPPQPFGRLGPNEIIVQFPAVTSRSSDWASAPPLVPGEPAVFIFDKCWNCVPLTGRVVGRGSYYKAHPWVALGWGSKLPPAEWPRVVRLASRRTG